MTETIARENSASESGNLAGDVVEQAREAGFFVSRMEFPRRVNDMLKRLIVVAVLCTSAFAASPLSPLSPRIKWGAMAPLFASPVTGPSTPCPSSRGCPWGVLASGSWGNFHVDSSGNLLVAAGGSPTSPSVPCPTFGGCPYAVNPSGNFVNLSVDSSGNLLVALTGGAAGTVTTTGSPANGNLTKFSGATSVTNGNLSGDCTTTDTLAITCTKTGGAAFATSATTDTTSATNISSGTLAIARLGTLVAGSNGLATSATTDTTSATNISSGTLAIARLGTLVAGSNGLANSATTNASQTPLWGLCGGTVGTTNGTAYIFFPSQGSVSTCTASTATNPNAEMPVGIAGTAAHLSCLVGVACTSSGTAIKLYKNGSATALVCAIGTAATNVVVKDDVNTVAFTATDTYSIRIVTGQSTETCANARATFYIQP